MPKRLLTGLLLACWLPLTAAEGDPPQLWGYGVKGCAEYIAASEGRERGDAEAAVDYLLYREWISGLVTGLSLATGQDVLVGVDIEQALRRIELHCEEHREDDFFNASMALVRLLSML
jgi:hypothetical protein